jgi:hypothetical protein
MSNPEHDPRDSMAVVERLIAAQDAEHRATAEELAERSDAALRRLRRPPD